MVFIYSNPQVKTQAQHNIQLSSFCWFIYLNRVNSKFNKLVLVTTFKPMRDGQQVLPYHFICDQHSPSSAFIHLGSPFESQWLWWWQEFDPPCYYTRCHMKFVLLSLLQKHKLIWNVSTFLLYHFIWLSNEFYLPIFSHLSRGTPRALCVR